MNQTYITNATHFLDENGNIPDVLPRVAREFAFFQAMIVDTTTKAMVEPAQKSPPLLRCHVKGCKGYIVSHLDITEAAIVWRCDRCGNNGRISGWQETKWNNLRKGKSSV